MASAPRATGGSAGASASSSTGTRRPARRAPKPHPLLLDVHPDPRLPPPAPRLQLPRTCTKVFVHPLCPNAARRPSRPQPAWSHFGFQRTGTVIGMSSCAASGHGRRCCTGRRFLDGKSAARRPRCEGRRALRARIDDSKRPWSKKNRHARPRRARHYRDGVAGHTVTTDASARWPPISSGAAPTTARGNQPNMRRYPAHPRVHEQTSVTLDGGRGQPTQRDRCPHTHPLNACSNRGHWTIEATHHILDWSFDEDRSRIRTEEHARHRPHQGAVKRRLSRNPRRVLDFLKMTANACPEERPCGLPPSSPSAHEGPPLTPARRRTPRTSTPWFER